MANFDLDYNDEYMSDAIVLERVILLDFKFDL